MQMLSDVAQHLRRLATQPVDELKGAQRQLRYFIDLCRHCARRLSEDRAEEMAAALAFRTIFSLIPLCVLALVVFRMFGSFDDVHAKLQDGLYHFFGVPEATYADETPPPGTKITIEVPDAAQAIEAAEEAPPDSLQADPALAEADEHHERREQDKQVRASIHAALTDLTAKVANLDFTSIGIVGIAVFIYAAMALAIAVERDFNIVCKSPRGRSWGLRVPIYWSLITLGSGLLAASLYITGRVIEYIGDLGAYTLIVWLLTRFLALVASWVLFYLLYVFIPNTKVKWKPALIGSFLAAMLWELGKVGFQVYVATAVPYSQLYGALGLIPLFLFWIYCSWLVVLFGLEVAYTLQVMPDRVPHKAEEEPPPPLPGDPQWLIPLLVEIGQAFDRGQTLRRQELGERLGLPSRTVDEFARELEKARLIHCLNTASDADYTLARPPDKIYVTDLLDLGHQLSKSDQLSARSQGTMLERLHQAEREVAADTTLAQLIAEEQRRSLRVETLAAVTVARGPR